MKKEYRVKKSSEIDAIIRNKKSNGNNFFVIYNKETTYPHPRFAISIGRKYGSSVQRNKIKRQIRYAIRQIENIKTLDYVVVVKPKASTLSYQEIESTLKNLINKTETEKKK
ncbi:MAG: ribonuclease P protein component [Acholeplasmataceae bacterium]